MTTRNMLREYATLLLYKTPNESVIPNVTNVRKRVYRDASRGDDDTCCARSGLVWPDTSKRASPATSANVVSSNPILHFSITESAP